MKPTEYLPKSINLYIPQPQEGALNIVGLVKRSGKISGYQLSNGTRVNKAQGVALAKQNRLSGVAVAMNQGTEYLRGVPGPKQSSNNLGNLPAISE